MSTVEKKAEQIAARGASTPRRARDPVNQAMVNNWVEAIGDNNPVYTAPDVARESVHGGLVAPPAMAQVWTMNGLHGQRAGDDPLGAMMEILDEAGFTSVVATDSEQIYHRYLRQGEQVDASSKLESVVGPKRTALGEGWFVTTRTTWTVEHEPVAEMVFRVLKFAPPNHEGETEPDSASGDPRIIDAQERSAGVLRPVISEDSEFFWEGTKLGQLRIQRWGSTLRHPPGPMPPAGDVEQVPDYLVASGKGHVFSYIVHHHPNVPGKEVPFVVALVELEEGVRVLGELIEVDPESVHIGLSVEVVFLRVDDELTLPAWRAA